MSEQSQVSTSTLSRRSAVRGAVWTVPAVTVAVAAPAYATSHGLTVSNLDAAYVPGYPEQLSVTASVTGFTDSYDLALSFPSGLVDTVNGHAGPTVSVPSSSSAFHTILELGSVSAPYFRGFRGPLIPTLTAVATDAGGASHPRTTTVQAYPVSKLEQVVPAVAWVPGSVTSLTVSADNVALLAGDRSAVGRLRIAVILSAEAGGTPPVITETGQGWQRDPLLTDNPVYVDNGWLLRFTTTKPAHTARTGVAADRGPSDFRFSTQLSVAGSLIRSGPAAARFYVTTDETSFDWPVDESKIERQEPTAAIP